MECIFVSMFFHPIKILYGLFFMGLATIHRYIIIIIIILISKHIIYIYIVSK